MPTNHLYDIWKKQIMELRPGQRITQIRAFVSLIVGIFLSHSVNLRKKGPDPETECREEICNSIWLMREN